MNWLDVRKGYEEIFYMDKKYMNVIFREELFADEDN